MTGEVSDGDKHIFPSSVTETILPCEDDHGGPRSIAQKKPQTPARRQGGLVLVKHEHSLDIFAGYGLRRDSPHSLGKSTMNTEHRVERHGNHPSFGRSLGKSSARWCRRAVRPTTATVAISPGPQVNRPTRETQKLYSRRSSPRSEMEKYLPLLLLGRSNGTPEVWFRALYLVPP